MIWWKTLETVLSITTGRMFTKIDKIYDILNFLYNDNIFTHQIPKILKISKPYILDKYPQLASIGQDVTINTDDDIKNFLDTQKSKLGNSFTFTPIPKELYKNIRIEDNLER